MWKKAQLDEGFTLYLSVPAPAMPCRTTHTQLNVEIAIILTLLKVDIIARAHTHTHTNAPMRYVFRSFSLSLVYGGCAVPPTSSADPDEVAVEEVASV